MKKPSATKPVAAPATDAIHATAHLIALKDNDHIVAIEDRRHTPAVEVVIATQVPAVPTAAERKAASYAAKQEAAAKRVRADVAKQLANEDDAKRPTYEQLAAALSDAPKDATYEQLAEALLAVDRAPLKPATKPDVPRETTVDHSPSNKLIADMLQREVKDAPAIPDTGYQGPMRALRDRVKAGAYKKAANGQPSCGDEVATILGALEPFEVIRACMVAMDLAANPYLHLNIGQQSMNLRNKLRGQLKRAEIGMGVVREAAEVVLEQRPVKTPAAPAPAPVAPAAEPVKVEAPAPAEPKAKRASKAKSPRAAQGK